MTDTHRPRRDAKGRIIGKLDLKPAEIAEQLLQIKKADKDGKLRASAIVAAASVAEHPLHGWFTWDPKEAAAKYRLVEARRLVASVWVEYRVVAKKGIKIGEYTFRRDGANGPAFLSPYSPGAGRDGYQDGRTLIQSNEMSEVIIREARTALLSWLNRYRAILFASGVMLPSDEDVLKLLKIPAATKAAS